MIGLTVILLASSTVSPAWGQFAPCTGGYCYTGGNVGIGTTSPQFSLDVNGEIRIPVNTNLSFGTPDFASGQGGWINYSSSGGYLVIEAIHQGVSFLPVILNPTAGNVGIGTTSPGNKLTIQSASQYDGLVLSNGTNTTARVIGYGAGNDSPSLELFSGGVIKTAFNTDGRNSYVLNGSVGIGTTSPCATNPPANCKLSVAGGIQAQEVVVNTGWSDYVFGPNYRLRPLAEVATYIRENHHLPDIPTEAEVKEKGVSLGEMQSKLLAKVEELTLHMIELEHENSELKQSVRKLQATVSQPAGDGTRVGGIKR
jgi:hypothetical protein